MNMNKNPDSDVVQSGLVKEFYEAHPNKPIKHAEAVDWLVKEYNTRTGKVFRDPDRAVRKLYAQGYLIKDGKGVYRYDPSYVGTKRVQEFSTKVKMQALARDNYKCVICGLGRENGVELHVDHIKPQDMGGQSNLANAQTLCSKHNFLKKNLNQTETGKKLFIRLYEKAKEENDKELIQFCEEILETFERHNINGHIEWKRKASIRP